MLENEVVISEIVLEGFTDDHTKDSKKIPHIPVLITWH